MQSPQKKPKQLKKCQKCMKEFPFLYKTVTDGGVRKKVCQKCASYIERDKLREKKEKSKQRRKVQRERITEKKLDTIFSRLVRNIYPPYCHSSKVPITVETSHCAHLVGRNNRCVRWDLRNCYSTTPQENMHNQLHVIQLAKRLYEYYEIDIDTWESASKQTTCKLTEGERREMYEIFKEGLDRVFQIGIMPDEVKERKLKELRMEIISKTKKIL